MTDGRSEQAARPLHEPSQDQSVDQREPRCLTVLARASSGRAPLRSSELQSSETRIDARHEQQSWLALPTRSIQAIAVVTETIAALPGSSPVVRAKPRTGGGLPEHDSQNPTDQIDFVFEQRSMHEAALVPAPARVPGTPLHGALPPASGAHPPWSRLSRPTP